MIELLVRGHVPEWGGRIDYSTLEQLPPELVSESLQRRYPDMMWRVRTGDGESDLLILLEFQARPDRFMALRTTTYACLALEGLVEHKALGRDGRLPEVVSLVLHHGDRPWNAPVRLAELFGHSSPGVYRLVSRRSAEESAAPSPSDLPSMALALARERTLEEMRPQLGALKRATEACRDEDFDQFMGGCVRAMLVSRGFSGEQLQVLIPTHFVHRFRRMPSTDSDSIRPLIPTQSVHRFRRMSTTRMRRDRSEPGKRAHRSRADGGCWMT